MAIDNFKSRLLEILLDNDHWLQKRVTELFYAVFLLYCLEQLYSFAYQDMTKPASKILAGYVGITMLLGIVFAGIFGELIVWFSQKKTSPAASYQHYKWLPFGGLFFFALGLFLSIKVHGERLSAGGDLYPILVMVGVIIMGIGFAFFMAYLIFHLIELKLKKANLQEIK